MPGGVGPVSTTTPQTVRLDQLRCPPSSSAISGAEGVFASLYRQHYQAIVGYVLRRTDDPSDAADVVAETFLVAWRRIDVVPEGENQRPWLYGVARRVLANHRRSTRRRRRLHERLMYLPLVHPTDGQVADPPVLGMSEIHQALDKLRPRDREILLLTSWEGLSAPQLATALGCSPGAAAVRLHRARRRLADLLTGDQPSTGGPSQVVHGSTGLSLQEDQDDW